MYLDAPVGSIDRNPDQPRKHFDPEALDELAGSIKANGLLEPIVVRPHPEPSLDGGQRWLIIAGERRWRAAQQAGITAVPVRVLDVDEVTAFELSVAENVNRHDMTPMEEARAYETLLGYDRDVDAIAKLFGKSTVYVKRRLDLLRLIEPLAEQVDAGRVSVQVATMASGLNESNQRNLLYKLMRGDFATENEALHWAYAVRENEDQISMFTVDEPSEEERAERAAAKRKVKSLLEQAERLTELLGDLAVCKPEEFAALGGEAAKMVHHVERMARQISKVQFAARQGAAIADARATTIELAAEAAS